MVVVLSRFRVANGMDESVKTAFENRPHLVEEAAGFAGLEVFTDARDTSVFFLLTRWTDFECYRRWHGSQAHRQSHAGIPKGLKLDATFTKVWELESLSSAT